MTMKTGTLTLLMVLGTASADAAQFGDFTYQPNGAGITITSYSGQESEVTIPTTIEGLSVTEIGEGAFARYASLAIVTIPADVTRIGESAFSGCTSLTAIHVDDLNPSFLSLDGVLFDSYGTTLIRCPEGKSGEYAIPDGVTHIARNAISWCSRLTELTIPDSVRAIGSESFSFCYGLTELTMPDSVVEVGRSAFQGCYGLTNITLSNGITRIETYAFAYCTHLAALTIPDAVVRIGYSAFTGCMSLTSLTIPHAVTDVGDYAFQGCSNLTNATLGKGVAQLGQGVFDDCSNLSAIDVDVLNPLYSSLEGTLFNRSRSSLIRYPGGKAGDYTIPDGVTRIEDRAFFRCTRLTGVSIPTSVAQIGKVAFAECGGLTIPDGVNRVGERAFAFCTRLTSIAIPNSVIELGDYAMTGCYNLTSVMIPRNVTAIGWRPFSGSTNLSVIDVDPANIAFRSHEGVLIDRAAAAVMVCPEGKIGNYTIPDGIVSIGDYAFAQCTRLATVTIPESVANLGEWTFFHCTHLVGAYFAGNAPAAMDWSSAFVEAPGVIVYHRQNAAGWTPPPPYLNRPTALWLDPPRYSDWLPSSGLPASYPGASAEADDPDGDGMSNVAEMLASTDPIDRASALVLELEPRPGDLTEEDRLPLRPDQYAIYFRSVPGKQYAIQRNDSLSGPPPPLPWTGWSPTGFWWVESVMTAATTQTRVELDNPPRGFCRVILAQ